VHDGRVVVVTGAVVVVTGLVVVVTGLVVVVGGLVVVVTGLIVVVVVVFMVVVVAVVTHPEGHTPDELYTQPELQQNQYEYGCTAQLGAFAHTPPAQQLLHDAASAAGVALETATASATTTESITAVLGLGHRCIYTNF